MSFGYFAAFFSSSVTPARVSYLMFCHLILHRYINLTHPRVHYDMFLFLGSHRPHLIVVSLLSHCFVTFAQLRFCGSSRGHCRLEAKLVVLYRPWPMADHKKRSVHIPLVTCHIGHIHSSHACMPHWSHPIRHIPFVTSHCFSMRVLYLKVCKSILF